MPIKTEPFIVNLGPVHPSTHGVFRLRVELDGEVVVDLEPVFGYLHRGIEKLAEERTYGGFVPLTDRLDYLASMSNNFGYVLTVEKLAGIKIPERAEYIRVIMAELQRIATYLVVIGAFVNDCGAYFTPFLYMWREREKIIDLFEMASGQRLTYNYMRIGGVSQDIPEEFLPAVARLCDQLDFNIDEFDQLLKENEILLARTRNIGILSKETAINCGITGPVLRASGVKWDIRRADPYSIYDRFEFDIPIGGTGDTYDRYRIRVEEMRQSLRIIRQAIKAIPGGPVRLSVPHELPHLVRPPAGDVYGHIETPKGELGFYIVSDTGIAPYRCHIKAPSFINLTPLKEMIIGWKVADLFAIFGSIDLTMGEVDR